MTPDVKPFGDLVVLKFLEPEHSEEAGSEGNGMATSPAGGGEEATIALVIAAGPESPAKKGDMVFVDSYARHSGTRLDEDTRIVGRYHLLAKIVSDNPCRH